MQSYFHADTFCPTVKSWLPLTPVAADASGNLTILTLAEWLAQGGQRSPAEAPPAIPQS